MAEAAAGLALGVLGVAGLFSVCVQAFDMVQIGLTQDRRLRILATKLDNQKVRFIIWGKALGLDGQTPYDERLDEAPRKQQVTRCCELIRDLFTESQTLEARYGLKRQHGPNVSDALQLEDGETSAWRVTFRRMRALRSSTQAAGTSRSHTTRWVIRDQKEFLELVQDLRELVDDLESLTTFHDVQERQRVITTFEVQSIPDDESVRLLEEAAADEHGLISDAASFRASSGSISTEQQTFYSAVEWNVPSEITSSADPGATAEDDVP